MDDTLKIWTVIEMIILSVLLDVSDLSGQTSFCPDDPPNNPWLADSPYPIYHRNSYGQASTCLPGIQPEDSIRIKVKEDIQGGTSPWIYLSDAYPNGERTLLYSNSTHIFKLIDDGNQIVTVDSFRLDFNTLTSNGYNHLLSTDHIWFSYEPTYNPDNDKYSQLFKFTDADIADPYSEIVLMDMFDFGDYGINRVNMYNLNYNGEIVWYSEKDAEKDIAYAGVIDQDFNLLDTLVFATLPNERVNHNSISVDENDAFYIVTSHRLIQFAWDGSDLIIGWQAVFDFVNDGPTGNFAYGSGTTPTLMGWGEGNDKLVVVADGHANNNLVAFWRELPEEWNGIPGMPLHFADSISIPNAQSFSNLFQSIENSPTANGYEIAIAQFNGFLGYDCENLKGVQKFAWDTLNDRFDLLWANDDINMNGVLVYSAGSDIVYGTGKEADCHYYYYGLDWATGDLKLRLELGPEGDFPQDPFYDQGVNHIIDEAGNMYYSGSRSLVKLEKIETMVSTQEKEKLDVSMYPNPTDGVVFLESQVALNGQIRIYSVDGKVEDNWSWINGRTLDISGLPRGIYIIEVSDGKAQMIQKVVKL